MLKMFDTIVVIILAMPLYVVLIWSYFYPQESLLWGKRWMYKFYLKRLEPDFLLLKHPDQRLDS